MNTTRTPSTKVRTRVLVVEDEEDLQDLLRYNLERDGFAVSCVDSGESALDAVDESVPELVILDLMLPGIDGLEVCRKIRANDALEAVPIVMLTAKGEEADIVTGLELGADDYITKPFSPRVLLARLRAVLRRPRSGGRDDAPSRTIRAADLTIDIDRHEVRTGSGETMELTATEFKLLSKLAMSPGRVFTRQQIVDAIHEGFAAVTERSVDVLVVGLRRKLGDRGNLIETVRGVGYRFKD